MEVALRYEIEQKIPEFNDEIHPTNAPETSKKPYLVYYKYAYSRIKTLDGYTNSKKASYIFSIMALKYNDMKTLTNKVEELLISIIGQNIGEYSSILVEDVTINKIEETYEFDLKLNRGIVDFTIYF